MPIEIDEDNLKHGLLGLVVALLEVIRDALRHQAVRRVESGVLSDEECERLGRALMELEDALEEIKEEQGITESVRAVRDGLDELVDDDVVVIVVDLLAGGHDFPVAVATDEVGHDQVLIAQQFLYRKVSVHCVLSFFSQT